MAMSYWVLCLFLSNASALTLEEALQSAADHSPSLQVAQSAAEEADWKKVEAFSTFLPTLTASANYLADYRYALIDIQFAGNPATIPQILPTTVYSLTAQYTLFENGNGVRRWRAARSEAHAARQNLNWQQFQLQRATELQFFKVLSAQTMKTVAEQNLKTLEEHRREVGLLRKVGSSTAYDQLRVDVQVSEAQSELLNADDNIQIELGRLAETLGLESVPSAEGNLPEPKATWIDGADESWIAARPDLAASEDMDENHRLQAAVMRPNWLPKLSAFWNYQSYNNRNDEYDDWSIFRSAYSLGLNATWDLFDGFATVAKSRQAAERYYQSEKGTTIKRLKAKQDFQMWKRKYAYFCELYRARQGEVLKAKESVRLAKEGRRVGARTNSDMLDAENDLYRAQAGLVTAQLGALEALVNFELATGRSFYSPN